MPPGLRGAAVWLAEGMPALRASKKEPALCMQPPRGAGGLSDDAGVSDGAHAGRQSTGRLSTARQSEVTNYLLWLLLTMATYYGTSVRGH